MAIMFNSPAVCPVLIGRQSELTTLHALAAQARAGRGQVLLLAGEAGIGKSRLAAEAKMQARTQGFLVLQGNCYPNDRSSPYAPLLDLLTSPQSARLEPLPPELALLYPGFMTRSASESRPPPLEP